MGYCGIVWRIPVIHGLAEENVTIIVCEFKVKNLQIIQFRPLEEVALPCFYVGV